MNMQRGFPAHENELGSGLNTNFADICEVKKNGAASIPKQERREGGRGVFS
jgi:hypothetical protein